MISTGLQPIFQNVPLLVPGKPLYLLGSLSFSQSPTKAQITNVALTTNVVTLSLQLTEGLIPVVNQLINVQQCSQAAINGVNYTITGVSGFNTGDNSTGTVTFALTHANIATIAATGNAIAPIPVTADVCANETSWYAALPYNDPRIDQSRTLVFQCAFPSVPVAATVTAYVSDDGITFYSIGAVATVAGSVVTGGLLEISAQSAAYVQVQVSGVSGGTNPTVWCTVSA